MSLGQTLEERAQRRLLELEREDRTKENDVRINLNVTTAPQEDEDAEAGQSDVDLHDQQSAARARHELPLINPQNLWYSGCFYVDKRVLSFTFQIIFLLISMGLCIVQLLKDRDCQHQREYMSLLTFLIGVIVPNPSPRR